MPAKSEKQRRFMALVATGKKKVKGLTPDKAHEFMYKPKGGYSKDSK
jgi:hypothetical protein